jgi:hypothetical protein
MVKVLKTSAEGRKCQYHNCTQTLSIYNHETYCHIHRDMISDEQIGKNIYPHHFHTLKN